MDWILFLEGTAFVIEYVTDRQTDRQTNRQTDRQIDKQTDRRTDRQIGRHTKKQSINQSVFLQLPKILSIMETRYQSQSNSPTPEHTIMQATLTQLRVFAPLLDDVDLKFK